MRTGRPRKLDLEGEDHIRLRVTLAKQTGVFSQAAVAEGFALSIMTLRRYYLPKERRASQLLATRKYEERRLEDRTICDDCHLSVFCHPKCADCSILLHHTPVVCRCGAQHGLTIDGKYCSSCAVVELLV